METQRLYPRAQNYSKDQRFPAISKPSIVGFFNLNDKREYEEDISSLGYFKLNPDKKVEFDLNVMENRHQDKPDSADKENLDHILTFIQKNFECLRSNKPKQLLNSDFICFRGLLRLLMCTPYENRDPWLIRATKFKGSIYLCALDTQEKIQERANRNEMNEKVTSKFVISIGFNVYYNFSLGDMVLSLSNIFLRNSKTSQMQIDPSLKQKNFV